MTKDEAMKIQEELKRSGGPVYPRFIIGWDEAQNPYIQGAKGGITRRDLVAMLAMQGMLANIDQWDDGTTGPKDIAKGAYTQADAMIAEGRKGGE